MKFNLLKPILFSLVLFCASKSQAEIEYINSYGGNIRGSLFHGDYAYLSQRDTIRIFDVRDKKRVHEVGVFLDQWNGIERLEIKWPVIFYTSHGLGSYSDFIDAVNVTNPAHPQKVTYPDYFMFAASKGGNVRGTIRDSRLFAIDRGVPCVYDISNPLKPVKQDVGENVGWADSLPDSSTTATTNVPPIPQEMMYAGNIRGVKSIGDLVYVVDDEPGLKAIDISDPKRPMFLGLAKDATRIRTQIDSEKTSPSARSILVDGKYEIAVHYHDDGENQGRKLMIRDISNPKKPRLVKYLGEDEIQTDNTRGLCLKDHLIFQFVRHHNTGCGLYSMSIYDVHNPEKPKRLGSTPYPLDGHFGFETIPESISVSGKMIYVANGGQGMAILRFVDEKIDRKVE